MPTLSEKPITFDFPVGWEVTKYEEWIFYKRFAVIQTHKKGTKEDNEGTKAVDFLAFEPAGKVLWLIEVKDFRSRIRDKPISLWDEIALKARDTLAGIFAAAKNDAHADYAFACNALTARKLRVVLHLEQTSPPSKKFPLVFVRANLQQKLSQTLRAIDAHPKVVEIADMRSVPWTATFL